MMTEREPHSQVTITEMTVDDIEAATEMRLASWLDTYVNEAAGVTRQWVEAHNALQRSAGKRASRRQRFAQGKQTGTFNAWVAKDAHGVIVGSATPFIDVDGSQHVGSIYVDKNHHGSGLGSKLMQNVVDWFDDTKQIELGVAVYNDRAKAFYRKWGFEEVTGSMRLFDNAIPEVTMVRKANQEEHTDEI